MRVTATELPGGLVEQSLTLHDFRICVLDQPHGAAAERTTTVSARRPAFIRDGGQEPARTPYEVVYISRGMSPQRRRSLQEGVAALLDELTAQQELRTSSAMKSGDKSAVAALISDAARAYNTTPTSLVEAVRRVGSSEISEALDEALHLE